MSYLGTSYIRVRPDSSGFESETKKSVLGTIGKIGGAAAGLFAGFQIFGAVKDDVIGFNSTLEQAHAAFKNLLGSGDAANKMLDQLQTFAKTTPFAFEQLIPVSQQLVGALGKSVNVTKVMTQLGDAISATGGDSNKLNQLTLAYTQMATSGTAHLGDLMQINNAVPGALARMAAAGGQSVGQFRESVSKGMVSSGEAVKLFQKVTTDPKYGIAGGMKAQSATFAGAMSNIGDAIQQGLASAGKPIFEFVSTAAKGFAQFLSVWQGDSLRSAILTTFGGLNASTLDQFIAVLVVLRSVAAAAFAQLPTLLGIAGAAFSGLATAIGILIPIITEVVTFVMGHQEVFGAMAAGILIATGAIFGIAAAMVVGTAAASAFGAALAFAFSPIVIIVVTIGLLVAALIYLYRNNETARTIMQAAWSAIVGTITGAISIIRSVIQGAAAFIQAIWSRVGSTVIALARNAWTTVSGVIRGYLQIIQGVINVFSGILHGNWSQAWNGVKQILSGALGVMKSLLSGAIGAMGILAANIGRAILNGIVNAVKGVGGKVSALIHGIPGAIGDLSHLLYNAGASLITGFISGITSKIGAVKDTLGGIASSATSWKGPPAYDARVLTPNGQLLIDGFVKGIKQRIPSVQAALGGIAPMAPQLVTAGGPQSAAAGTATLGAGADLTGRLDRIIALLSDHRVNVREVNVYSDTQHGKTIGRDMLRALASGVQR